jgi:small subunit ribosomal protein S17
MKVKNWIIVSIKQTKTIVVREDRHVSHKKYKKKFLRSRKFYVHTEDEKKFKEWEKITIVESRPYSKLKRWITLEDYKTNLKNDTNSK